MKRQNPALDTYRSILESFSKMLQADVEKMATKRAPLNLTLFSANKIITVCEAVAKIFAQEPIVLSLSSPQIIIGDLHGQLLDLIRIIKDNGGPHKTKYLFLGDLVDRGEFSIETILLVLTYKALWPQNVYIIRGNHEFVFSCSQDFYQDIKSNYSNPHIVFGAFLNAFSQMPLGAIIDDSVFAVHGGIGPEFSRIDQLKEIKRPLDDFGNPVIDSALWSDPNAQLSEYEPSHRGTGYLFGKNVLTKFLQTNGMKILIRGHESVSQGFEYQFNRQCLTVFSASNYCGRLENDGGVIIMKSPTDITTKTYTPLPFLRRADAAFVKEKDPPKMPPIPEEIKQCISRNNIIDEDNISSMLARVPSKNSLQILKY